MAKSAINQEILDMIVNSDELENIKKFIIDALEWEYDHIDESRPRSGDKYDKLVNKYIKGYQK